MSVTMTTSSRFAVALVTFIVLAVTILLPTPGDALTHHSPALTFERFVEIVGVTATALNNSDYAVHVKERFAAAKARLSQVHAEFGPNATFEVDFMAHDLWTDDERKMLSGGIVSDKVVPVTSSGGALGYTYNYVNYKTRNEVTPVRDQGQCGSCYAFAALGAIESAYIRGGLGSQHLSESQAVSCTYNKYRSGSSTFNMGCNGGNPSFVMQYYQSNGALTIDQRPYDARSQASNPACPSNVPRQSLQFYYADVQLSNEDQLAYLLNQNGPIAIFIYASSSAFQSYRSGVLDGKSCNSRSVDHLVLLVGVEKLSDGREVWVVKNSWGTGWGESGYVRFLKGDNTCNLKYAPVSIASIGKQPVTR